MNDSPRKEAIFRRLPVGAETRASGTHFRVWAPRRRRVSVAIESGVPREVALEPEGNGYFSALVPAAGAGTLYRFRLDGGQAFADPASRFQPQGPKGPSQVIDPAAFPWTDREWRGPAEARAVIYELHVGTFTPEGTWTAAASKLAHLADLGITLVELMPVADFCGRFGWGYDGVDLYAPTRLYGEPDDMRRFVDRAHALGLAVILDVVYNHCGPDGCVLKEYASEYFTDRYQNEWGEPINFDGEGSEAVREYFCANAGYWVDEFHLDGLRLDATQQMFDASPVNVMQDITRRVREAAGGRATRVIAENEPQDTKLVRAVEAGGYGIDALWNDDFHHSAMVAATGRNDAYYSGYRGAAQELVSCAKHGFLYQGQRYRWQEKRRGTPAYEVEPRAFVHYLQNHDQVANSAHGTRLHGLTSPGRHRALTALLLLGAQTPMLFQGQEFSSSSPFVFFADHAGDLAAAVRKGRAEFMRQFTDLASEAMQARLAVPDDPATFARCKLDWSECERNREALALHRDLARLRRDDGVLAARGTRPVDGAVLADEAFALRFFGAGGDDRLLVVNLGRDLVSRSIAEPLLAPPRNRRWKTSWSSEDPRYGGGGATELERDDGWRIPGHAAAVLAPAP